MNREIVIPKDTPVVVTRLLRYDDSHGEPHYNANDQIIFVDINGTAWRFSRKDAPDHFIGISGDANLLTIADAYRLPDEKRGPVGQYSAKGAKLHVDLREIASQDLGI